MKKPYLIIIACVSFAASVAQTKTCSIPVYGKNDTTLWYTWRKTDAKQMGLADLTKSQDSLHFRFWTETQAIEIWTNDFKTYNGLLSNHTEKIEKDDKPRKFYSNKTAIDTATARKVYNLFADNLIFQIPDDKDIKGWDQGFDGEELLMEYSTKTTYSFKRYWTPSAFKELKEAVVIEKSTKDLEVILDMEKSWSAFLSELPEGCYRAGEMTMTCTDKKKKGK